MYVWKSTLNVAKHRGDCGLPMPYAKIVTHPIKLWFITLSGKDKQTPVNADSDLPYIVVLLDIK